MRIRSLELLSVLLVAVAGVSADTPAAAAQARSARGSVPATNPGRGSLPPRTPDGHPDLQGTWDFRTLTPLERPGNLAGKQVLTDEEAAALEQRAAQNRVDRAPRAGDPGTYNQFWFDFGTTVLDSKRTSLIVDPADGKLPPLTPPAEKRAADRAETTRRPASGPEDRTLWERCLLGFNSGPPMMPSGYNNNFQLVQTGEYVVILNEMVHDARIVPLGTRPHGTTRQWMGDARGRWEGDTLVIETVNFTSQGTGTIGLRASVDENLRLVERLTLTGADTLLYEFTVDDPTVWARPWTAAIPMKKTDGHIYEYACHEGNHGMVGILAGARADEKAAEEAAKKQLK
jgi:hypothetical protein